jgi:hypothetical protein
MQRNVLVEMEEVSHASAYALGIELPLRHALRSNTRLA